MHRLRITNCKSHIEEVTLKNGSYSLGRSFESSIRLESTEISRLHARLLIGNHECEVIDESSANGTFVNGEKVISHRLRNGDIIGVGKFKLEFIR